MSMAEKAKRYPVLLCGLFISSLGVSIITKADLGTSPISAIPYVLSLNFPWTLGGFTVVFSLVLILLQVIILRKNFKLEHLLQIPIPIAFGWFIDLTMVWLSFLAPQSYPFKLISLLEAAWRWPSASIWRCWPASPCCPASPLSAASGAWPATSTLRSTTTLGYDYARETIAGALKALQSTLAARA